MPDYIYNISASADGQAVLCTRTDPADPTTLVRLRVDLDDALIVGQAMQIACTDQSFNKSIQDGKYLNVGDDNASS